MRLQASLGVSLVVLLLTATVPAEGAVANKTERAMQAFAQVEKPRVTQRVQQWTRARLEAAKKTLGAQQRQILGVHKRIG